MIMNTILETLKRKWVEYILEIIVIVGSILGAFALDNWNDTRIERKEELKYLANLKTDLMEDLLQLEFMIEFREKKFSSAKKLLNYYDVKEINNLNNFFDHFTKVLIWLEFSPNKNTIDELVNSGNLSLIKNDSIKNLLLSLNQLNKQIVSSREHTRREFEQYLYDRIGLYINLQDFQSLEDFRDSLIWKFDPTAIENDNKRLKNDALAFLSDRIVRNGLFLAGANNVYIISQYKSMQEHIRSLIKTIDEELFMR